MSEQLHYVKVVAGPVDEDGWQDQATLTFECRGNRESNCHNYPGCECEYWDETHEHPSIPQDECWMQGWFENDGHFHTGDDSDHMEEMGIPRSMTREGFIIGDYEDGCVAWDWAS